MFQAGNMRPWFILNRFLLRKSLQRKKELNLYILYSFLNLCGKSAESICVLAQIFMVSYSKGKERNGKKQEKKQKRHFSIVKKRLIIKRNRAAGKVCCPQNPVEETVKGMGIAYEQEPDQIEYLRN